MIDTVLSSFFCMWTFSFPVPFVEDAFFYVVYIFGFFVKYQMAVVMCSHVWAFYCIPLAYISIFVLEPYHFYYCITIIYLEFRNGLYHYASLLRTILAIHSLLWFHMNVMIFSIFLKSEMGILINISLNL